MKNLEKVNNYIPNFFKENDNESDAKRILSLIERHIEKRGSLPLITLKNNALRSEKEKSLMFQLDEDNFKHDYNCSLDLKLSSGKLILTVYDKENNKLSILEALLTKEKQDLIEYNQFDVDVYDVDVFNSKIKENGKILGQFESSFGQFFENLFEVQYYDSNNLTGMIETEDGFNAIEIFNLNSFGLMHKIRTSPDIQNILKESIEKSNNFEFVKNKRQAINNSEPSL